MVPRRNEIQIDVAWEEDGVHEVEIVKTHRQRKSGKSLFPRPVPRAVTDVKDLDRCYRHLINDNVGQTGNHKFPGARNSSIAASVGHDVKGICGVKERHGNGPHR